MKWSQGVKQIQGNRYRPWQSLQAALPMPSAFPLSLDSQAVTVVKSMAPSTVKSSLWRLCSNWQNCTKSHLRLEPSRSWLKGDCCSCQCPTERSSHPSLPCPPPRAFRRSRGPWGLGCGQGEMIFLLSWASVSTPLAHEAQLTRF